MRSKLWQVAAILGITALLGGMLLVSRGSQSRLPIDITTPEAPPAPATAVSTVAPVASPTPVTPTPAPVSPSPTVVPEPPTQVTAGDGDSASSGGSEPVSEPDGESPGITPETAGSAPEAPTETPTAQPSATSVPTVLPSPVPTAVPTNTAVPPPPVAPPAPTSPPSQTATASPTVTPTATRTATRTPTPSPTIAGPFAFQVLPSGDFQVYRGGSPQIAGSPPAGGIKLYLDGNEYHTPAAGRLGSGSLLSVAGQVQLGENVHATTFTGTLGLTVTQTISYAPGTSYFQLRWDVSSPARADARLFYAFDSSLDGNDLGDPYYDAGSGRVGVWSPALHNRFMGLQPVTPASAYTVGPLAGPNGWAAVDLSALRSFVGSGTDNYLVGLQWNTRVRSDALWTVEVRLTFAPPG